MTPELKAIHDAACLYAEFRDTESLKGLLKAAMNLPLDQWPEISLTGVTSTGTLSEAELRLIYGPAAFEPVRIHTPFIVAETP